jgi:cystathionine beta-lyase/cystathionine gamma-synthase
MRTFRVRLAESCRTAASLAAVMETEPGISRVVHPSRADHPDAGTVVDRVMPDARGAMLTLVVDGGDERALQVVRHLEVAVEATSLGGVETLASLPFNSSHFNMSPEKRLAAGILPGMVRLSVGLEGEVALHDDLRQALKQTS